MKWFFENPEAVIKLRKSVGAWKGTPFRQFSRAKGASGGVDCVGWCEALMQETGVIGQSEFIIPRLAGDYSHAMAMPRVLRYFRGEIDDDPQSLELSKIFSELDVDKDKLRADDFLPGDIVVWRKASQFHVGVVSNGFEFVYVATAGVGEGTLQDAALKQYLVAAFRARARRLH